MTSTLTRLTSPVPIRQQLAIDVRRGLTGPDRWLPPVYFYDARGSELFERITELDEYYLTRAEHEILEEHAGPLMRSSRPDELVELGSGSSTKTGLLLEAMRRSGGQRYAPLEISEAALIAAIERLTGDHPWLQVDGYVGDFHQDIVAIPRIGRRVIAFLGSTLGNLGPQPRRKLLRQIARALGPGDHLLLGVDLVKDPQVLLPAYDDAQGVTGEFNRNVLRVINRELGGDIPVEAFRHRAVWNAEAERIEMHLVATTRIRAELTGIGLPIRFEAQEHIVTEHSHKFRIAGISRELHETGLDVVRTLTDRGERFAVILAAPGVDVPT